MCLLGHRECQQLRRMPDPPPSQLHERFFRVHQNTVVLQERLDRPLLPLALVAGLHIGGLLVALLEMDPDWLANMVQSPGCCSHLGSHPGGLTFRQLRQEEKRTVIWRPSVRGEETFH